MCTRSEISDSVDGGNERDEQDDDGPVAVRITGESTSKKSKSTGKQP
jgi:hypothetical protein